MKTYDEVFQNVMEATNAHRRKVKKIQKITSVSMICAVCIIGASMYMKLEKPESVPPEIETTTVPKNSMTNTTEESISNTFLPDPTELYSTDNTTFSNTEKPVFSETSGTNESSEKQMPVTTAPQESIENSSTTLKQEKPTESLTEQASDPETKPITQTNSISTQTALIQTVTETVFTKTDPAETATEGSTRKPEQDYSSFYTTIQEPEYSQTEAPMETTGILGGTSATLLTTEQYSYASESFSENSDSETTTTIPNAIPEETETEPDLPETSEIPTDDFYDLVTNIPVKQQTITEVVTETAYEIYG